MTYVHGNGNDHEFCVEAHKRLVLGETDLFDESDLDNAQEVPIETGVDNEDEHLGDLVPDIVDLDKSCVDRWYGVRRNPNTKDGDVDCGDDNNCTPFDVTDGISMFGDKSNAVDNDLHEQLNLENPEEENEEQDRDTVVLLTSISGSTWSRYLTWGPMYRSRTAIQQLQCIYSQ